MTTFPSFDINEVKLLANAVEKVLANLRDANEKLGGNDIDMLETGRRYAQLLQKLQAVTNQ